MLIGELFLGNISSLVGTHTHTHTQEHTGGKKERERERKNTWYIWIIKFLKQKRKLQHKTDVLCLILQSKEEIKNDGEAWKRQVYFPGSRPSARLRAACRGIPVPAAVPQQPYITALWPSHRPIKALISWFTPWICCLFYGHLLRIRFPPLLPVKRVILHLIRPRRRRRRRH